MNAKFLGLEDSKDLSLPPPASLSQLAEETDSNPVQSEFESQGKHSALVAQLVERLIEDQEANGSTPFEGTNPCRGGRWKALAIVREKQGHLPPRQGPTLTGGTHEPIRQRYTARRRVRPE